jgi:amino acid adenylation domain-containing protein
MFATLKAGGAYVPLDPDYPPERIAYMVESAGIEAIVASQRSFATLAAYSSMLVDIDDPAILLNPCERPLTGSDDPDSLAYVLFTSGSTGKPKAVAVPHRGVVALVTHPPFLASKPSDTVLLQGTLNFDLSVQMIWAPLIFGARLAIMPTGAFSSAEFVAQLTKYRVTGLFAATPLFHQLVEERLDDLRLLRCCIVAGDVLSPIHSGRFASEITGCRLFNGYGPTEATVIASVHEVLPDAAVRRSVPIGRPCAETRLYILDEMQKPVAIGVPGELWIGGSGVARGYLNDLALSQERFVRDPFSTDPCARLYRSGDRARWLPGGEIEFLGRADAQLKIRGFRIEPAEVEFALLDHPMVRHAAVVARGDASNLALIGYAEVRDARLTEADLRAFLQMKLPPHAIPSRLILVDSLPKTASGKIDRRGLPEPSARPVLTDAVVPAGDELQQSLIRLWEELLEVHPVGIRDDFFALGGHSLLAARLVREIERLFCVRLPLAILFERATVEQLADAMRLDAANLNQSPIVTFNTAGTKQPFFYLHGSLAGGGYYCSALAKYLGADRPVFAMRPHGVDGSPIPPTIEDIAAECIIALKSVLPQGPYLLGGWSGAGLVAFEMACQLAARGERVDNVLMIDASHAGRLLRAIVEFGEGMGRRMRISSARGAGLRKTVARLAYHFARFRAARDKRKYLELTVNRLRTAMDPHRLRKRAEATSRASAGTGELQHAWEWISDAYVPRRYAGRLTVLMPEEEPQSIVDAQGWLSVTARIDIRSVPGDHLSCITEHIEATAEQMADSMRF